MTLLTFAPSWCGTTRRPPDSPRRIRQASSVPSVLLVPFLLLPLLAVPASGTLVKPVSAISSIAGDAGSSVDFLLDDNPSVTEAGLQDDEGSAVTLDSGDSLDKALATYGYRGGDGHQESWTRGTPEGNPVFTFDLTGGGDTAIGSVLLWQYGNDGGGVSRGGNATRQFSLIFHTEAEGGSFDFGSETIGFTGTMDLISGTDTLDNLAQLFYFGATSTVRYVALRIDNNYGGQPGVLVGGDRYGLGEVRFATESAGADPVIDIPSAFNLNLDGSVQIFHLTLGNLGATQDLVLGTPGFGGTHAAAFTLLDSPASIAPGADGIIEFSFNPTGLAGNISAELTVTSNDVATPSSTVALTGFLHDPKIEAPATLDFGRFPTGSGTQTASLAIKNAGGGQTLAISSINVTGTDAANFSVLSSPAGLAPLATGSIQVQLDPGGGDGQFSAQLEIHTDDVLNPVVSVNLTAVVGDLPADSGVRINEFMASNDTTIDDGDGNSSDWIELYNAGPGDAFLSGWSLTDDANNLTKWSFPPDTVIPENGYLLVFASGKNVAGYVDPDGHPHTTFKLTTNGEYLALVRPDGFTAASEFFPAFPAQFTDISYGAYSESAGGSQNLLANSDADVLVPPDGSLGLTWTAGVFVPDAGWMTGGTGIGVGYDTHSGYDPYIDIDIQSAMSGVNTSAYIRIPFEVTDATAVGELNLTVRYDDGFVAYLNGTEIASRNAPSSPVWDSNALESVDESNNLETIDVSAHISSLRTGSNVLAIHALNRNLGSSDLLIDPELLASEAAGGPLQTGYLTVASPGAVNGGGAANPGPGIAAVAHTPGQPNEAEDLVVTASVAPRQVAVASVVLHYRVAYGTETEIPMADDGSGGDALAGDGIFTATIPSAAYGPEQMVRWHVTAEDTAGNPSRLPVFLDRIGNNRSPEYFGTVVVDPGVGSDAPLFQWFTENESASHTRSGARASVWFLGRFYDNIFVRQRGQATNAAVSQKFDFNKGDPFDAGPGMESVGEVNINGRGADSTYIRQPLAFDAHRAAGVPSCISALWNMRVNGSYDRIGVMIEQVDEDFMKRYDYDPDGDLYKFVQRNNLLPVFNDTLTGIEKKTNDKTDFATLDELIAGLHISDDPSAARRAYVLDHLDLPQVINYLAVRAVIQDADDIRKNFYMYRDIRGDDLWRIFPWDKDFTFGVRGDGGVDLPHPFFGDEEHQKWSTHQWNVLFDMIFEEPVTRRLYLRRLRTLTDTLLQPASTPMAERHLENQARAIIDPAAPPLSDNVGSIDSYLSTRRNELFTTYSPSLIPDSQPTSPDVAIAAVEANPSSGNQDEEWIRLTTTEDTEIDLSGWTLDGGVAFTFPPGTVIERGGDLYLSPDTLAFRNRTVSPKGGEELLVVGPYSGHLSNFSEVLTLRNAQGVGVDTFVTPNAPSDAQLWLVATEVMYHPADPNGAAEFIELMNTSTGITLDLDGVRFSDGIDFTFAPGTTLAPGARILVVFNQAAFEAVYGSGAPIAGEFQNATRLGNGGDRIVLDDANGSTIFDFTYDDLAPWPAGADGGGFSLVLRNPAYDTDPDDPANWRESGLTGGNPGGADSSQFAGDPNADLDRDGITALLEHAFGTSDTVPNTLPFSVTPNGGSLRVTMQVNQTADDVVLTLESSGDMVAWGDASAELPLLSRTNNADGTATLVFQSDPGFVAANPSQFVRVKVVSLP